MKELKDLAGTFESGSMHYIRSMMISVLLIEMADEEEDRLDGDTEIEKDIDSF